MGIRHQLAPFLRSEARPEEHLHADLSVLLMTKMGIRPGAGELAWLGARPFLLNLLSVQWPEVFCIFLTQGWQPFRISKPSPHLFTLRQHVPGIHSNF